MCLSANPDHSYISPARLRAQDLCASVQPRLRGSSGIGNTAKAPMNLCFLCAPCTARQLHFVL